MTDVLTPTRTYAITRRAVVRTGTRLAYVAPLVAATFPLTSLSADAEQKRDAISADAAVAAVANDLPPVANAGPNVRIVDADGDGVEAVILDGSGSSDPDGAIVSYEWTLEEERLSLDRVATVVLPIGKHSVYLRVTDDSGASARDRVWVRVDPEKPTPTAAPQPPAAPSNVEAAQRQDRVSVTWQDESDDATGFRVYRSDDGGSTWAVVGEASADRRSLRDGDVAAGATYAYVVAAFNDAGESAWPEAAWVTLDPPAEPAPAEQDAGGQEQAEQAADAQADDQAPAALEPPTRPTELVAKLKQARVELRWRNDAGDAAGFRVYRSDDGGNTWNAIAELPSSKTTYRDGDVAAGATYAYVVAAFNDAGESAWPEAAWVTLDPPAEPAPQDEDAGGQEQAVQTASDDGTGGGGDQGTVDEAPAEDPPPDAEDGGG